MAFTTVEPDAIRRAALSRQPYDFLLGNEMLKADAIGDLRRDFPDIEKPGYLTVDEVALKGRFKTLIEELESPGTDEELSTKFGRDLHAFPRLTTIMKRSQPKYGSIHTDGPSKVMTMLVYMNDAWEADEGGRLRVLYDGQRFEPYAVEVPPVMGTVFAFCEVTNPGTVTGLSRASARSCRWPGSRTPTNSRARRSEIGRRSSSRACSDVDRREGGLPCSAARHLHRFRRPIRERLPIAAHAAVHVPGAIASLRVRAAGRR
jgi:hypothetical protein